MNQKFKKKKKKKCPHLPGNQAHTQWRGHLKGSFKSGSSRILHKRTYMVEESVKNNYKQNIGTILTMTIVRERMKEQNMHF